MPDSRVQLPPQDTQGEYGPEYYKHGCGPIPYERNSHWLNFFGGISEELIRSLRPKRMFDAGCAWGFLVESLQDRGVEAWGIDISEYAIENTRPDIRRFCSQGSLTQPIGGGHYDLVTCIEVLEHMPEADARLAIQQMTLVTDTILFSSTPDDFNEPTHVNVHPVIYWMKLFAEFQFHPDITFDGSFLSPHAFLLRKSPQVVSSDVLVLFSETLRLRSQRAAFLTRHGRIEELEQEREALKGQVEEASRQLTGLLEKQSEMRGFIEGLSQERNEWIRTDAALVALREEYTLARFQLRRLEDLERETNELKAEAARTSGQIAEMTAALSAERARSAGTETELAALREELTLAHVQLGRLRDLEKETDALKAEAARTLGEISEMTAALSAERERSAGAEAAMEEARNRAERSEEELRRSAELLKVERANLVGERREAARWQEEAETLEAVHRQSAEAAANLQYTLDESRSQVARTESMVEEWMAHSADLSRNLEIQARRYEALQAEKESLFLSPGWRLILRYREWLRRGRIRYSWVHKYWEPSLLWALRQAKLGNAPFPQQPVYAPPTNLLLGLPEKVIQPEPRTPLSVEVSAPRRAPVPVLSPPPAVHEYEAWIRESEPDAVELEIQRRMSECFTLRPTVSVLVPVYKVPVPVLRDTIDSVLAQTYRNWELCITVPDKENEEARAYLEEAASRESRIRVKVLAANQGISGNSNQALTLATGEYVALLDHDDTLAPFALFEVVQLLNQDPDANFIYSDKDQITEDGKRRFLPLFKPQWSPEIMLNANYLTHLCVMRTNQVREIGGWRSETDGAQDWDLFLRIIRSFGRVRHIPKVLYHWRHISTSVASGGLQAKPYAALGQVRSVKDHCDALGLSGADVGQEDGILRVKWPEVADRISIIYVSSRPNAETLARADSLAQETRHGNFEILVPLPGEASGTGTVKCIRTPADATLLDRIELGVRHAAGGILVFVDDRVRPLSGDWLVEIVGPLQLQEVGIVGAKLLDTITRTLRHCGIIFAGDGRLDYIYAGQPEHVSEQAGTAGWYRNWSAVSGACFAMRRRDWDKLGGMAGKTLHPRLDVHLNLKLQMETDLRIVYNPFVRMLQDEESAFESDIQGQGNAARALFPDGDPFFSPHLDCRNGRVTFKSREQSGAQGRGSYETESRVLVDIFDFVPAQVDRSKALLAKPGKGRLENITWFLPEFNNAFYGGVHTILRFANAFLSAHQVRSTFCTLGRVPERRVRAQVAAAFPVLAAGSDFFSLDAQSQVNQLPQTDAAVCSLWTTAYAALEFEKARRKFYFIQDDEALFYPAGSISALVEATYRFGFYGVCNTVSLLQNYAGRGGEGEFFSPCVDTNIFHDRNRVHRTPYTLFCYGRPGHPRNSFELLSAALRLLKQRMGSNLLAICAGAEWEPRDYQLDGVVHNLGILSYRNTGALYRMCDAGVAIMMTRHPSYLPMELMACGSLVVTNRNPDTSWLLTDGENCLLSDLSASSLANRIQEGLENERLRTKITRSASDFVQANYSHWEEQVAKVYRYMLSLC